MDAHALYGLCHLGHPTDFKSTTDAAFFMLFANFPRIDHLTLQLHQTWPLLIWLIVSNRNASSFALLIQLILSKVAFRLVIINSFEITPLDRQNIWHVLNTW